MKRHGTAVELVPDRDERPIRGTGEIRVLGAVRAQALRMPPSDPAVGGSERIQPGDTLLAGLGGKGEKA